MTETDDEDFKNSTQCQICHNIYVKGDIKVRDHCHITRNYGGSVHNDCNLNIKLKYKIPVVFHN